MLDQLVTYQAQILLGEAKQLAPRVADAEPAEPAAHHPPSRPRTQQRGDDHPSDQPPRRAAAQHQLVERVGEPQHLGPDRMPLLLIAVQQTLAGRTRDGGGRIHVTSGWVMHSVDGQETLVPAGSDLDFTRERSGIPLAVNADAGFRAAIGQFDRAMAAGQRPADAEALIAREATAADRFTLLTLLTRYPALASGPLYPKLATMFDETPTPGHREAWRHGSVHAMNQWWEQIPRPPKAWWLNWRDALG